MSSGEQTSSWPQYALSEQNRLVSNDLTWRRSPSLAVHKRSHTGHLGTIWQSEHPSFGSARSAIKQTGHIDIPTILGLKTLH